MWPLLLIRYPINEWHMTNFVVRNRQQKETCYNKIVLCAQNIDTILGSFVIYTIGRAYTIT